MLLRAPQVSRRLHRCRTVLCMTNATRRDQEPPNWIFTWASDIAPGDLIKFRELGDAFRIKDRTYPGAYSIGFRLTLADGTETGLLKSTLIWIFDPDGSVLERIKYCLRTTR